MGGGGDGEETGGFGEKLKVFEDLPLPSHHPVNKT